MNTFMKGLVCSLLFVFLLADQAMGESFTRLLQCDGPSNPVFKEVGALVVQRPENPKRYRLPRIVLNFKNGTRQIFRVDGAGWFYFPPPIVQSDVVNTWFQAINTKPLEDPDRFFFKMRSNGSFQPLSGEINYLGPTTTFRTCGVQSTSAYYWTRSGMYPNEAFACPGPFSPEPAGCPGIGSN